ncbi:hypothetical protein EV193_104344 [Herbihabitans rhizosphaerae]|uniref:Uncharacterized protein n=1 Tax=Herbihabitans rhizosphaerae TaxID=1872711 RepID=A0A4Q7KQL5_9PSEU|nr:hypothetical protein [Herbihabitans rhizosphaerae]RZS39128.1 hypothetical protein EV193_104344 [Herbihabitans rhizosphaerae]
MSAPLVLLDEIPDWTDADLHRFTATLSEGAQREIENTSRAIQLQQYRERLRAFGFAVGGSRLRTLPTD